MDLLTSAADLGCDPRVSKGVVECIRHSFLGLLRLAVHRGSTGISGLQESLNLGSLLVAGRQDYINHRVLKKMQLRWQSSVVTVKKGKSICG